MKLVVFGATGPTGRLLTSQALHAGHDVVAVTRRPADMLSEPGISIARADVLDADAVAEAVAGSDAVLSVIGGSPSRRPISVYSQGTANIVEAMRRHGSPRLVVVSSSALDPSWRPSGAFFFNNVLDPYVNRTVAKTAHDDMRRMEALLGSTDLAWTVVRPSGLFDHPSVTNYRLATGSADGLFTARSDLASAMLAQLTDDRFVRKAVGVVTKDVEPTIIRMAWQQLTRTRGQRHGGTS
jgi:putative NADH-flavin reductase